jgi:multiple antibiotic resistance protein
MSHFEVKLYMQVFVTLFVIMDPLGTVPIFLSLSMRHSDRERRRLAGQAVLVAGGVIGTFALFGQQILEYLGITVPAVQGAGGLLLLLVALELLRGEGSDPEIVNEVNVALVPLGTPLLAGPGAIAATIVFVRQAHGAHDASAIVAALASVLVVLYLVLRSSSVLLRILRPGGIHLMTRIFGLLLSAIAIQLVAESAKGFAG